MIRFVSILVCMFLTACNENYSYKKGKVEKEIREIIEKSNKTYTYSTAGFLMRSDNIDSLYFDGKVPMVMKSETRFSYDNNNNLVEEITFNIIDGKAKEVIEEKRYKYNSDNHIILELDKINGFLRSSTETKYDLQQRRICQKIIRQRFDSSHNFISMDDEIEKRKKKMKKEYDTLIISFDYDRIGRLIKEKCNWSNHKLDNTKLLIYDSDGKLINEIVKNSYGDTTNLITYEYLDSIKMYSFNVSSFGDTVIFERFDKQKDTNVTTAYSEMGIMTNWTVSNKVVKNIFYSKDRKTKRITTYRYDRKGNQIEMVFYK